MTKEQEQWLDKQLSDHGIEVGNMYCDGYHWIAWLKKDAKTIDEALDLPDNVRGNCSGWNDEDGKREAVQNLLNKLYM